MLQSLGVLKLSCVEKVMDGVEKFSLPIDSVYLQKLEDCIEEGITPGLWSPRGEGKGEVYQVEKRSFFERPLIVPSYPIPQFSSPGLSPRTVLHLVGHNRLLGHKRKEKFIETPESLLNKRQQKKAQEKVKLDLKVAKRGDLELIFNYANELADGVDEFDRMNFCKTVVKASCYRKSLCEDMLTVVRKALQTCSPETLFRGETFTTRLATLMFAAMEKQSKSRAFSEQVAQSILDRIQSLSTEKLKKLLLADKDIAEAISRDYIEEEEHANIFAVNVKNFEGLMGPLLEDLFCAESESPHEMMGFQPTKISLNYFSGLKNEMLDIYQTSEQMVNEEQKKIIVQQIGAQLFLKCIVPHFVNRAMAIEREERKIQPSDSEAYQRAWLTKCVAITMSKLIQKLVNFADFEEKKGELSPLGPLIGSYQVACMSYFWGF